MLNKRVPNWNLLSNNQNYRNLKRRKSSSAPNS
jgi:hypothetical protein